MKVIKNTSVWRTDDVMKLARKIADLELNPEHRKRVRITIKSSVMQGHSGCASCPGSYVTLRLPTKNDIDPVSLAMIIGHEFAHLRGMTHRMMLKSPRYTWKHGFEEVYAWARLYTFRRKGEQPQSVAATSAPMLTQ